MSRPRSKVPRCRHCGYPIAFVALTSGSGRPMPVDPAPDEDGNVVATTRAGRLVGHVLHKNETVPTGWLRYMPHHATCGKAPGRRPALRPLTLFDQIDIETR